MYKFNCSAENNVSLVTVKNIEIVSVISEKVLSISILHFVCLVTLFFVKLVLAMLQNHTENSAIASVAWKTWIFLQRILYYFKEKINLPSLRLLESQGALWISPHRCPLHSIATRWRHGAHQEHHRDPVPMDIQYIWDSILQKNSNC